MGSPNDPGMGDRPANGDGSTDMPPWQNATRSRADGAGNRPVEAPVRAAAAAGSPGLDPRRYITGSAAPDLSSLVPAAERTDVVGIEPYRSELPDLSGPAPKPPQPPAPTRKSAAEPGRLTVPQAPGTRVDVGGRPRGPVRATMQIRRIDPWSALKVSLVLNVALFFVWMIAVAFLYLVLGAMGVWSKLNSNVGDLLTSGSGGGGSDLVSAASIFGGAALVGLVNIVLLTAMATIGAYIYNLSTDIVGGVEVTLADLD